MADAGTLILAEAELPPGEKQREGNEEDAKVFMCSICQMIFASMEEIEAHILTHQPSQEEKPPVEGECVALVAAHVEEQALFTINAAGELVQLAEGMQTGAQVEEDLSGLLQQ